MRSMSDWLQGSFDAWTLVLWQRKGEAGNADQNTILEHGIGHRTSSPTLEDGVSGGVLKLSVGI